MGFSSHDGLPRNAAYTISIIVPVYNEEDNIDLFYARITDILNKMARPYEVIFINDGSKDATVQKILTLREKNPSIKLIDLSRNFGKEIASTAGLDYATGDVIIPIDVDLQDPPELIPALVAKWQEGYDVVYATRQEREGETLFKKATAHLFYKIINKLSNIDIPQNTGDFRLFSRQVLDSINQVREKCRFMKGVYSWVGFKQTSVFYDRSPRHQGNTKWNYRKLWNLAVEGITAYSIVPLQIATYLGVITACAALIYGLFFFFKTIFFGNPVPGYPSLLIFLLFFSGVQLTAIGIIGEYIGRIYIESKDRPLYIERQLFGLNTKVVSKNRLVDA